MNRLAGLLLAVGVPVSSYLGAGYFASGWHGVLVLLAVLAVTAFLTGSIISGLFLLKP